MWKTHFKRKTYLGMYKTMSNDKLLPTVRDKNRTGHLGLVQKCNIYCTLWQATKETTQKQQEPRKSVIKEDEWRLWAAKFSPPSLSRPPHVLACHCREAAAASSEREMARHLVALFCSCLKSGENQPIISPDTTPLDTQAEPHSHAKSTCVRRRTLDSALYCGEERETEKWNPNENLLADGIAVRCDGAHLRVP